MKKKSKNILNSLLDEISSLDQSKTDAKMIVAKNIDEAMKSKKWKSRDLLEAIGKESPSLVTKWLSGTHNFTIDTIVALEQALDISILNLEDPKRKLSSSFFIVIKKEVQISNPANYINRNFPHNVDMQPRSDKSGHFTFVVQS